MQNKIVQFEITLNDLSLVLDCLREVIHDPSSDINIRVGVKSRTEIEVVYEKIWKTFENHKTIDK